MKPPHDRDNTFGIISDSVAGECLYWRGERGGACVDLGADAGELPADVGAVIVAGSEFGDAEVIVGLLRHALRADLPILAIAGGMPLLNEAMLGEPATADCPPVEKQRGFIPLGSKLGHIVGGSGWLEVPIGEGRKILTVDKLADNLFASCYGAEREVFALEKAGHSWVLGLRWHLLPVGGLPRGFEKIFDAFVSNHA